MENDEQFRTPLFDAMVNLAERRKVSFHTPGHKSGKGISTRFRKFVGPKIFSIDLTTLDEVDSLQKPRGVIKEAQELASKAYGADRSFFLLNGTTGGNHAMVLSVCKPGDKVLVARNAHKSVLAGMILCGATPLFFSPAYDQTLHILMNVTFEETKTAIDQNPDARAIFLTSPNYYGVTAEIEQIIPYAHDRGMTVLVDEAHGPPFKFHPSLPISALEAGADIAVQSTHKIIGGMTQASMLHAQGDRINMRTLTNVLKFVQTTSPSYILMASLDLARMQMATEGKKLLEKTLKLAEEARLQINRIPGFSCFNKSDVQNSPVSKTVDLDVTKLTITVKELSLSGYQVLQILNISYNIQVEMADPFHILVIVSIGDRKDDLNRLVEALKEIAKNNPPKPARSPFEKVGLPLFQNKVEISSHKAFFSEHQFLKLPDALGRISSEMVTVYPPGIPVLIPGEVIAHETIAFIKNMDKLGATIDGLNENNTLIGVVKKP